MKSPGLLLIVTCALVFPFPCVSLSSIWPMPQSHIFGVDDSFLDQAFTIYCATSVCPDPLPQAMTRYRELTFVAGMPRALTEHEAGVESLAVSVSESAPLNLGVCEVRAAVTYCLHDR